jgi:hypothetical protein
MNSQLMWTSASGYNARVYGLETGIGASVASAHLIRTTSHLVKEIPVSSSHND